MRATVDLSATRDCYCLASRKASRAITRLYEERLRRHGLRATQFSVLAALALKGPSRIVDVARTLGLERTTLSRVAAVLERNGWLDEAPSRDGRERLLRLTDAGLAKVQAAFPDWQEAQSSAARMFEAGQLTRIAQAS